MRPAGWGVCHHLPGDPGSGLSLRAVRSRLPSWWDPRPGGGLAPRDGERFVGPLGRRLSSGADCVKSSCRWKGLLGEQTDAVRGWHGCRSVVVVVAAMAVRDEVARLAEEVVEAAERWRLAEEAWEEAVARRARVVAACEQAVQRATGGTSLAAWERDLRRRRVRTVADATSRATALRRRGAVEAALAEAARSRKAADLAVAAAREALGLESARLVAFGPLAVGLVGRSVAELEGLAGGGEQTG